MLKNPQTFPGWLLIAHSCTQEHSDLGGAISQVRESNLESCVCTSYLAEIEIVAAAKPLNQGRVANELWRGLECLREEKKRAAEQELGKKKRNGTFSPSLIWRVCASLEF